MFCGYSDQENMFCGYSDQENMFCGYSDQGNYILGRSLSGKTKTLEESFKTKNLLFLLKTTMKQTDE